MRNLNRAAIILLIVTVMAVWIPGQDVRGENSAGAGIAIDQTDRSPAKRAEAGQPENVDATQYPFTALSGVGLDDMSSGTTQLIAGGTDDANSALAPIGFFFRFAGSNYTDFGANGNGVIRLGAAITTTASGNFLSSSSLPVKIAPYWDDLCVGNGGKVHYKTTGAPGSRKLVVEWSDMKITKGAGCSGVGGGNFQMWLFEGTGIVQFVYGGGMIASAGSDGGYTVGIAQNSSNFASITTVSNSVSYSSANDVQISAIPAGTSYLFSPPIPAAPTGPNVDNLTQVSLRITWTDVANNESAYIVRRSLDNVNFTVIGVLGVNAQQFSDNGLEPGTQYFYKVNAASDGALSADLNFSPTTNPSRNISSVPGGGPWSAPATWVGGNMPLAGDNVTISGGSTVTLDISDANINTLTVGNSPGVAKEDTGDSAAAAIATLTFPLASGSSIAIRRDVLVNPEGVIATAANGTISSHFLGIGGNLTNNGTLDLSTNNNVTGVQLTFTGAASNTFSGNGPVTDIKTIVVDKGNTRDNVLELTVANFSVAGSTTPPAGSDYLTLKNGTFKISGTFTGSYRTLLAPVGFGTPYNIPITAGFWLNNPNYTVAGQAGSPTFRGLLRITAGTFNVGTQNGDSALLVFDSTTIIEGGNVNTTGRFSVENSASKINYYQTGGTVTTCTVGHFSTSFACFDMGRWLSTGANVVLSGGDIVIQNATQIASGPRDYRHQTQSDTPSASPGTTLHFGNALTPGGSLFHGTGAMPNLDIGAGQTLALLQHDSIFNAARNVTVGNGSTLDIGSDSFTVYGSTFVNNGTLIANAAQAGLFLGSNPALDMAYSGTGSSLGIIPNLSVTCDSLTLNAANNIRVRDIHVFSGDIINAGKLTLGNNDATISTISFGNLGQPTPGGTFDSAPVFDLGTGDQGVSYLHTGTPQATGPEINPSRSVAVFTYNDSNVLTLNGGDLTVTSSLNLTSGEVFSGASKVTATTQLTVATGFVNGVLERRILAVGGMAFPVGLNGTQLSVSVIANSVTAPSFLSIRIFDSTLPGLLPSTAASLHWNVVETGGDMSATLGFTYSNADVNGNEANYKTWRSNGGSPVLVPGSNANPGANTVTTAFGVTDLTGDWGVGAELDPGPVSISGRVTTSSGNPIRNAAVTISGGGLPSPVTVFTGSLGTYSFSGLQAGNTYTVQASAKRYRFAVGSQTVTPVSNLANVDFAANPQEEF
jgi:hypothetical protein